MGSLLRGLESIIGGEDGPTSVFIAGKDSGLKIPLRARIRKKQYQIRRKRVEKKIQSGAHTVEETILYAKEKYGLLPVAPTQLKYQNEKKSVKEAVIYKYKPELLGEFQHISAPDISDEKSMQEFYQLLEDRERVIETISDEEIFMDFKMYELVQGNGHFEFIIHFIWFTYSPGRIGNRLLDYLGNDWSILLCMGDSFRRYVRKYCRKYTKQRSSYERILQRSWNCNQ